MAKREHVALVKAGKEAIEAWRRDHPKGGFDLTGASLSLAELVDCDLRWADLRQANLEMANLSRSDLSGSVAVGARFEHAYLIRANLDRTTIEYADFTNAIAVGARIRHAKLTDVNFSNVLFDGCSLAGSTMSSCVLARCDLSRTKGLRSVRHRSANSIGLDTLTITLEESGGRFRPDTLAFFRNAGVPLPILDYLPDLTESQPIQFVSCFISYGDDDKIFVDKLYRDLKREGFRCWKFDEDAIIGKETWANIGQAISLHEEAIVVCSRSSLRRPAVQREIERILRKEDRLRLNSPPPLDSDVLVPIMLDDFVLSGWKHPRQDDVVSKVIGDFREWDSHTAYRKSFRRLKTSLTPQVIQSVLRSPS